MTSSAWADRLRVAVVAGVALAGVGVTGFSASVAFTAYEQEREALEPPPFVLPGGEGAWYDELDAFVAEYGGFPPHEAYSSDELARAIQFERSNLAGMFASVHPNAEIPEVAFVAIDDDARESCLANVDLEVDGWGLPVRISPDVTQATTTYRCFAAYPPYPHIMPTDRESRWQYAYLVGYMAACYEAHGLPQTPAPPEDIYVGQWPRTWYPQAPEDYYSFLDAMGYPLCPDLSEIRSGPSRH